MRCRCRCTLKAWPTKPIRFVIGPAPDVLARLVGQKLTDSWGQQVLVDNCGGSVVIPGELVAKAAPDGHTLLVFSNNLWLTPFLEKVTLDPVRDFAPITGAVTSPNILIVHPLLPVSSVKALIALARSRRAT